MRIAVDLMGSDSAPEVLFQGVLQAAHELEGVRSFVIIATPSVIEHLKHSLKVSPKTPLSFVAAIDFIQMDDAPMYAIRRKKEASLLVGLNLLKEKEVDAFISAGNTGALVLGARTVLSPLPGVQCPALLAVLPTQKDPLVVIDVGGNLSCEASDLLQFAYMGTTYQKAVFGKSSPKVGLLNIGNESKKGTKVLREAHQLLQEKQEGPFAFIGNVEGKEVFSGKVDVLVTEGFTGNIFLKTSEGVSSFLLDSLKRAFQESSISFPPEVLQKLKQQFSSDEYPGAVLCGLDGIVVKCHGDSSAKAMFQGIKGAAHLVKKQLVEKLKNGDETPFPLL